MVIVVGIDMATEGLVAVAAITGEVVVLCCHGNGRFICFHIHSKCIAWNINM